ncbi:Cytochrome c oxidase polypeptide I+III [Roseimaritima ulvae]|uniref:Cytochrome c oxidase polypeptide I+III n=2 Tax=Roseimaritima ulvae TaxID=980254 RepID=A0A5B9QVW9_9BACT|nr:Cytochrome c oxidase polypeptide I+III [Roseimaritima ulvae]
MYATLAPPGQPWKVPHNKRMPERTVPQPLDRQQWQGAALFLASLFMFFVSSIILYFLYAYWRRDEPQAAMELPGMFLISTVALLGISVLVHKATKLVRRDRCSATATVLGLATVLSFVFMVAQGYSMWQMLQTPQMRNGFYQGVGSMVVVLAILHALHVVGGIIALGLVGARCYEGRYDHERHGAVDFAAAYWHFLDLVWLFMLAAFWSTTAGFNF